MKFGSITTGIVSDGLVFNMDAANRASYVPNATSSYNTIDLSVSGSFINDPTYISPPTSASCWQFDGIDDRIAVGTGVGSGSKMKVTWRYFALVPRHAPADSRRLSWLPPYF